MSKTKSRSTSWRHVGCVNRERSGFANEIYSVQPNDISYEHENRYRASSTYVLGTSSAATIVIGDNEVDRDITEHGKGCWLIHEIGRTYPPIDEDRYQENVIEQIRASKRELLSKIDGIKVLLAANDPASRDNRGLNWFVKVYDPRTLIQGRHQGRFEPEFVDQQDVESLSEIVARNESASMKQRFDALFDWLRKDKFAASGYILSELARANGGWRDVLVHASMDTWFDDRNDQAELVALLLDFACARQHDTDASSAAVTRTAILRAGSLMESSEMERFLPLFNQSKTILSTLIAMQRIVTIDPPDLKHINPILIEKLFELTHRYSDPQVHERGKIGAALMNAMNLLAILDVERFSKAVADMARLNKPWLFEHLLNGLKEIQQSPNWQSLSESQSKAGSNLVRAMEVVTQVAQ